MVWGFESPPAHQQPNRPLYTTNEGQIMAVNVETLEKLERKITLTLPVGADRKSTRLNSSHVSESRMPSSA